jgi:hypothetical protein
VLPTKTLLVALVVPAMKNMVLGSLVPGRWLTRQGWIGFC